MFQVHIMHNLCDDLYKHISSIQKQALSHNIGLRQHKEKFNLLKYKMRKTWHDPNAFLHLLTNTHIYMYFFFIYTSHFKLDYSIK